MTAREIQDILGSSALPIARRAGYSAGTWRLMVSKGFSPGPERREALRKAMAEHIETVRRVREEL